MPFGHQAAVGASITKIIPVNKKNRVLVLHQQSWQYFFGANYDYGPCFAQMMPNQKNPSQKPQTFVECRQQLSVYELMPHVQANFYNNSVNMIEQVAKTNIADRLVIRALTYEHHQSAMSLVEQTYLQQPLRVGFYKKFPSRRQEDHFFWKVVSQVYKEQFFGHGWSFGCFDLANNGELVAVVLAADSKHKAPLEAYSSMKAVIAKQLMRATHRLLLGMDPKFKNLLNEQSHKILNIQIVGIKAEYQGRQLLTELMNAFEKEAIAKGFEYSVHWSSHARTAAVLEKMDYEIASELNVHELLGFVQVEEEHKLNRLYIKDLRKYEQNKK